MFPERFFPHRYYTERYFDPAPAASTSGMRQLFTWRASNNVATGTVYNCLVAGRAWTATQSQATTPWSVAGTFKYLRVRLGSAPGSGKSVAFAVMKNGSATGLTCTISDLATTASDLINTVSVVDGDTLSLRAVGSGTPTVSVSDISVDFVSTSDYQSGYAAAPQGGVSNSNNRWTAFFGGRDGWAFGGDDVSICSVEGDLKALRVIISAAPAAAATKIYAVQKNGVVQDGTGGTVDTRVTVTGPSDTGSATFTLPVSPGDTLSLRQAGGTSGTFAEVRWSTRLDADTNGEFYLGGSTSETLGTTLVQSYNTVGDAGALTTVTTESDRYTAGSAESALTFQALYTYSGNVVSGNGISVKLRVNAADSALSVTHVNATHSVVADVAIPIAANLSVSFLGLGGGGFSRQFNYGFRATFVSTAGLSGDFDVDTQPFAGTFSGGAATAAEFDVAMPPFTAAFTGTESNNGDTVGTFQPFTGAFLGGPATLGVLDASSQPFTGAFFGGAPIEATIDVSTNRFFGLFYGGAATEAVLDALLPAMAGALAGGAAISGSLVLVTSPFTGAFTSGELSGEFAGTLPAFRGAFVGYVAGGVEATFNGRFRPMRAKFVADVPVDFLTLTVNGVPFNDWWWMPGGWTVRKDGEKERMNFYIRDERYHADATSIDTNDIVLLIHPEGGLIFGGIAADVERSKIKSEAGTLFHVTCNDWMFLADQVFVPKQKYASQDAYVLFNTFIQTYLAAKGVENIGAPTGGPVLPDLVIDNHRTSLAKVWDRMREESGEGIRINGDLKAAMVAPGSLIWPGGTIDGSNAKLIPDVKTKKEINTVAGANRLWLKTTEPPSGKGPYWHVETHVANGIATVFPLNVMPTEVFGNLAAEAAPGATTISLKELPAGLVIRAGNMFYKNGDVREYMVTVGAIANGNGEATISCETLELEGTEGTEVRFQPPTGMKLFLNDLDTPFAGGPWVYEPLENAFVNPAAAAPAGTRVGGGMWFQHPVEVRAWETAPVVPQLPIGWFDYSVLVDGTLDDEEYYDVAHAAQRLREKLAEPVLGKQQVTFETHEHGIYPWIQFPMNFPHSLVVGNYVAESVIIGPSGADKRLTTKELKYTVVARKDIAGRSPWDFYRKKIGVKWGLGEQLPVPDFQWSANAEFAVPAGTAGVQFIPEPGWVWTDWEELIVSTDADLIITALVVEEVSADQPYKQWSKGFEVQLAVGTSGDEEVIVNLKGHAKDNLADAGTGVMRLPVPVDACPAGSRLAIRMRASAGGFLATYGPFRFSVQYMKKPLTGNLQTTPYVPQITSVGDYYTMHTTAPVSDDWSDWTELLDDTPYDLYITAYLFSPYSFSSFSKGQIQFAIAGLGDEPTEDGVIADISTTARATALGSTCYYPFDNPLFVNSNQRIMVRTRSQGVGGEEVGFALHYVRAEE